MAASEEALQMTIRFIAREWPIDPQKLTPETRIERNLGITGDDAYNLMCKFFKEFTIDGAKFNFDDHFNSEGWTLSLAHLRKKRRDITIEDLGRAIETRAWIT
jgi:hypothetical protein